MLCLCEIPSAQAEDPSGWLSWPFMAKAEKEAEAETEEVKVEEEKEVNESEKVEAGGVF